MITFVVAAAEIQDVAHPMVARQRVAAWLGRHHPRDAPVHQIDLTIVADHHVLGLEIAVDHAAAVRERDGVEHLEVHVEQAQQLVVLDGGRDLEAARIGAIVGRALRLDQIVQRATFDELHREEQAAAVIGVDLVHRHDVRVVELPGDLRLADEAAHREHRMLMVAVHQLHGDSALEPAVDREVHRGHAAARDPALHRES